MPLQKCTNQECYSISDIFTDCLVHKEDGIPTLSELSRLALPPPPMPHPGHGETKEYAAQRKRAHFEYIREQVLKIAESKVNNILKLKSWQEKQDAVDSLFETVEFQLRGQEKVLGSHPLFGTWVETSLEGYLRTFNKDRQATISDGASSEVDGVKAAENDQGDVNTNSEVAAVEESSNDAAGDSTEPATATAPIPTEEEDSKAVPMFMDCFSKEDPDGAMVPSILSPLKPHHNGGPGRMVEEWELSAHSTSKRIMLRQSTRQIARALEESPSSRVYVTGRRGVGKVCFNFDIKLFSESN